MPLGELCAPFFTEGQELGFGSLDSAAIYKVFEHSEGGRGREFQKTRRRE